MLFDTQIKGRMGSPSVTGSTRALERGDEARIFLRNGSTPATAATDLPLRQRRGVEIVLAAIDRRAGEPADHRDDREPAPSGGPNLARREQSPAALIELRANSFPPLPNAVFVDHATDLRLFAAHRNPRTPSHSVARPRSQIRLLFGASLACCANYNRHEPSLTEMRRVPSVSIWMYP